MTIVNKSTGCMFQRKSSKKSAPYGTKISTKLLPHIWPSHCLQLYTPSRLSAPAPKVCNVWGRVLNFHDAVRQVCITVQCSVFKIKAKLTHKDMYLIGNFLIFYIVLFSLHSTVQLLSGRPWNNNTIRKVVCNFSILDVCRRTLQHGSMWSK